MTDSTQAYTYRVGKRVEFKKGPDEFVDRTAPDALQKLGIDQTERVSSASTRIRTNSAEFKMWMMRTHSLVQMAATSNNGGVTQTGLVQTNALQYRREALLLSTSELEFRLLTLREVQ